MRGVAASQWTLRGWGIVVLLAVAAASCGGTRDEAPGTPSGDPVEATLIVQAASGNARSAVLKLVPKVKLTGVSVAFQVPEGCTVREGATLRQLTELPADKPFETSIVFECVEPRTSMVQVELTATAEGGAAISRKLSTNI